MALNATIDTGEAAATNTPAARAYSSCQYHITQLRRHPEQVRQKPQGKGAKVPPAKQANSLMARTLAAVGLIQPLVVVADPEDASVGLVIVGGERLENLQALHATGRLADPMIDCRLYSGPHTTAVGLIENIARQAMHPLDECEAFARVVEEGNTLEQVAAMFAVEVRQVRQRLALANLAPAIAGAYRSNAITLDAARAYAGADPERQIAVWKMLGEGYRGDEYTIRQELRRESYGAASRLAKFVGLEVYREAGGEVSEDLFAEPDKALQLSDPGLLEMLAVAKMDEVAAPLRAEGFTVVVATSRPNEFYSGKWVRVQRNVIPKNEREKATYFVFPPDGDKAEPEGPMVPHKLAAQWQKLKAGTGAGEGGAVDSPEQDRPPESLMLSLTGHESLAMGAAILKNQKVALALMAAQLFDDYYSGGTGLHISRQTQDHALSGSVRGYATTPGAAAFAQADEYWSERVTVDPVEWFLAQPEAESLAFLSYTVARCYSVQSRSPGHRNGVFAKLAKAMAFELQDHFTATAANFFEGIPKAKIAEAVKEVAGEGEAEKVLKMKKGDAALCAEALVAGKRWLPWPMR